MSLFTGNDLPAFRRNRIGPAWASLVGTELPDNEFLLHEIQAAEADISQRLRTYFEPTKVFPFPPAQSDLDALPVGMPYDQEPGYDYDTTFFQGERWGFIATRHKPIISVDFIRFSYPAPTLVFYTIPNDWMRIDFKYGQINLVPATSTFTAPLSAFMLQALSGGTTIPFMMQVQYTAGLQNVRTDPKWRNLVDVIYRQAVLNCLKNAYIPQSGSISADGLSESRGFDVLKFQEGIDETLFGPKGSNGGLWTAIHGIVSAYAGVTV